MKKNIYVSVLLSLQVLVIQAATVAEVQTNLNDQAAAIKQLAHTIDGIQQKLGSSYGAIDLHAIDVPTESSSNQAEYANHLLQVANNQARAVNQIAEITMRLQHQAGIIPEDVHNIQ